MAWYAQCEAGTHPRWSKRCETQQQADAAARDHDNANHSEEEMAVVYESGPDGNTLARSS